MGSPIGNIKGTAGVNGVNGATWFNSAGAPLNTNGNSGDFDLDTDTGDIYTKVGASWTFIGNLQGLQGARARRAPRARRARPVRLVRRATPGWPASAG